MLSGSISASRCGGSTTSTTYPGRHNTTSESRGRSRSRPKTAASTIGGSSDQEIICAITESRGISPTVGLAFVNITTTEAILCQIVDNQTYVKTLHKLYVLEPSTILFPSTAIQPTKSKLYSIIEANVGDLAITPLDRKYWSEDQGVDYIQQLAFKEDVEAIKVAIGGNFFATCCFSAVGGYTFVSPLSGGSLMVCIDSQVY